MTDLDYDGETYDGAQYDSTFTEETYTRWLLRRFAEDWPDDLPTDTDPGGPLILEDRDESLIVDVSTGDSGTYLNDQYPTEDFDLSRGNALGVALTDFLVGDPDLGREHSKTEPVLSVRIEAAPERVHGHVLDDSEFTTDLVEPAIEVVQNLTKVELESAPQTDAYNAEPQNHTPRQSEYKDFYQYQFEVSLSGYQQL